MITSTCLNVVVSLTVSVSGERTVIFNQPFYASAGQAASRLTSSLFFFFSSRRRHTRSYGDWSSDVCSSDLHARTARVSPAASCRRTVDRAAPRSSSAATCHGLIVRVDADLAVDQRGMHEQREIGRASCRERV